MTAVETLRRAAALMREEAHAAGRNVLWNRVAKMAGERQAGHIARWHPDTAVAVADWLDHAADLADDGAFLIELDKPVAVARAYLGGEQP